MRPPFRPRIPGPPVRLARRLPRRPPALGLLGLAGAMLVAPGCSAAPGPVLDPPVEPALSPAPQVSSTTTPGDARPVSLCVLEDGEIAVVPGAVHPETGDTLIGGRPWGEVHRGDAPPYAAGAEWYVRGEMVTVPGRGAGLEKYGLGRVLAPNELQRYGSFRGLPLFVEAGSNETIADVVYVFVRPGCEFQTYLQAYTVGGVRGR